MFLYLIPHLEIFLGFYPFMFQLQDNDGNIVKGKDGKLLIHTDGTGFISEDLALKCPRRVQKGKCIDANEMEVCNFGRLYDFLIN